MGDRYFSQRMDLFLSTLSQGREVRRYLNLFSKMGDRPFAVIKAGGAILEEDVEALGQRLALLQALKLRPVLVYGAGLQFDRRLEAAGIVTERKNGLRVTPPEALPHLSGVASELGSNLINAIERAGGRARMAPIASVEGVLDKSRGLGHAVDDVTFRADRCADIQSDVIPLFPSLVLTRDGNLANANADRIARAIAEVLLPLKIVFLTGVGGVLGPDGKLLDVISLDASRPDWADAEWLHSGMRVKLLEIAELLGRLPLSSSVSMTTTEHLLTELFTHGGAGTLIRRAEKILVEEGASADVLSPILDRAFGAAVSPSFFGNLENAYTIRSERNRGAIIVERGGPAPLMSKFAVEPEARGEGLAKRLFATVAERERRFVWRAQHDNPFNGFYMQEADGFMRRGGWLVFWRGELGLPVIEKVAQTLSARPRDFQDG